MYVCMYIGKITDTYLPWVSKHLHGTTPDVLPNHFVVLHGGKSLVQILLKSIHYLNTKGSFP